MAGFRGAFSGFRISDLGENRCRCRREETVARESPTPVRFPGNQSLFRALELSVLSSLVGLPLHVHAEGLRGTGKTTIIRSLRDRLPRILRVKGCPWNCLPWAPHCPAHRSLEAAAIAAIGVEWVPMPFREVSHSAKVGTVSGSIDIGRLADRAAPEAAMLPGTIPQAHRGIIFVDEINRLADTAPELVDILLDVMGTKPGRLQVEETGLPTVEMPVTVSVWAASNPDEDPGPLEDIRKQLSDRFDFVIAMERPSSLEVVRQILAASRERLAGLAISGAPCVDIGRRPLATREALVGSEAVDWSILGETARRVEFPPSVEELVASLYVDFGLESLRAIEAIHHGAGFNCALERRSVVTSSDVVAVAPGALQHRLDVSTFARVMEYLAEKVKLDGADVDGGRSGPAADPSAQSKAPGSSRILAPAVPGGAGTPAACAGADSPGDSSGDSAACSSAGFPGGGTGAGRASEGAMGSAYRGDAAQQARTSDTSAGRTGRLGFWSLLGRHARAGQAGPGPVGGRPGEAVSPGLGGTGGEEAGPGSGGGGAGGGPGRGVRASVAPGGQGGPVAPPHPARSLSEILQEMEATGHLPSGPRPG